MRPVEAIAEVSEFNRCKVFDQPEKVGARWYERSPHVVFGETVELPEDRLTPDSEVAMEIVFGC